MVATYGRGFWILDDITPLRQLTPQVVGAGAYLFTPRPAYRFRPITEPMTMPDDATDWVIEVTKIEWVRPRHGRHRRIWSIDHGPWRFIIRP